MADEEILNSENEIIESPIQSEETKISNDWNLSTGQLKGLKNIKSIYNRVNRAIDIFFPSYYKLVRKITSNVINISVIKPMENNISKLDRLNKFNELHFKDKLVHLKIGAYHEVPEINIFIEKDINFTDFKTWLKEQELKNCAKM